MELVRTLLPLLRAAARLSPRVGRPLHGAALMHCIAPGWVLLRPPPSERRLVWAEEAVAVCRALVEAEDLRPRHRDLLARALRLHSFTLLLVGLVVNLISDLTYTWIDPRIDFETREV